MENLIASTFSFLAAFLLVFLIIILIIYIITSIFLNKLNKLIYGKGTALAWIPIANIYLLGKLTVNNIFGWILVFCMIIQSSSTVKINGEAVTHTILPEVISKPISILFNITIIILIICAIGKYINLKKKAKVQIEKSVEEDTIQDMQPASPNFFQPISIGKNLHTAEIPIQGDMQNNMNIQPNNIQNINPNMPEQPLNQTIPVQPMAQNLQSNIQNNIEPTHNNTTNQQNINNLNNNQNFNNNLEQSIPNKIQNEFIPVPENPEPIVNTTSNQPNFDEVFGVSMGHLDTDINSDEPNDLDNTIQSNNENVVQPQIIQQPIQQQIIPQQSIIQPSQSIITPNNNQVAQVTISKPQPVQIQQQPQIVQPINQNLQNNIQSNMVQPNINTYPVQNNTLNNQIIANQQQAQINMTHNQPNNIQTIPQANVAQNNIPQQQVINNIPTQPSNIGMSSNQQGNVIQPKQVINQNANTQIPVQNNINTNNITQPSINTLNTNNQVLGMNNQQQVIQPQQNINNNLFNNQTM